MVVIDTEERKGSFIRLQLGFCREIAESSGGHYYQLGDLEPGTIRSIAAKEIAGLCEAS